MKSISTIGSFSIALNKWIASFACGTVSKPKSITLYPFDGGVPNNVATVPTYPGQYEEELVLSLLSTGRPVHLIRTYQAPTALNLADIRIATGASIPTDADQVATVYSITTGVYDTLNTVFYPDSWPVNLARISVDNCSYSSRYVLDYGLLSSSKTELKQDTTVNIEAGVGVSIEYPSSNFVATLTVDEEETGVAESIPKVTGGAGAGANKHCIIPIQSSLTIHILVTRETNLEINTPGGDISGMVVSDGSNTFLELGSSYRFPVGSTSVAIMYNIIPTFIELINDSGIEVATVPVATVPFSMTCAYFSNGSPVTYSTRRGGTLNVAPLSIDINSSLSIVASNGHTLHTDRIEVYNYKNSGEMHLNPSFGGIIKERRYYPFSSILPDPSDPDLYVPRFNIPDVGVDTTHGIYVKYGLSFGVQIKRT